MQTEKTSPKRNKRALLQQKQELKWLLACSRRHSLSIVIISLLGILGTVMGLAGSVTSKYLVDGLTGHQARVVWFAGGATVALLLGNLVLQAVASRFSTRIRVKLRNANQQHAFGRILCAGWESLEPYRSGDLLQRLNGDISIVSEGIIGWIPGAVAVGLRLVGALAIMLVFDPIMALLILLAMPATLAISHLLMRRLRSHDQAIKEQGSRIMSFQADTLRNLTSIKAFAVTDRFAGDMNALHDDFARLTLDMNRTQICIATLTTLVSALFMGACFGWGAWQLWNGNMTVGDLTMFLQLMNALRGAFSGGFSLLTQTVTLTTSAGRVMAVEQLPQEQTQVPEGLTAEEALTVRLERASFSYHSGEEVLQPFDFTAAPGDTVAVTGPSGEGKTTLLRLLLGLVEPCGGSAALVGQKTYSLCAGTRCMFAYVPQGNSIFEGTVAENLRLVKPDATDEELEQVLKTACALDFVRQLPGGLSYRLGAGGRGISEGQAQRLAVARALLKKAPILLLDEATSAMDMETEAKLLENLQKSGSVRTCILVTHRPGSTAFCSRAYEIHDGVVTQVRYGA